MEHTFGDLLDRVTRLTRLDPTDAFPIAQALWGDGHQPVPTSAQIVAQASELGIDIEAQPKMDGWRDPNTPSVEDAMKDMTDDERLHQRMIAALGSIHISMDPAEVLSEVYMVEPRVLQSKVPVLGRAPDEAYQHFAAELAELPENIVAALVKIDLHEGKATYWLRDEANNVDRPIGPIDLARYPSQSALSDALMEAFKRMPRVLASDFN